MTSDHRDLMITDLADENAALRADVVAHQMLGQQAIHALHDLTVERDRLRQQLHRLIDEYRRLRAQIHEATAA